MNDKYDFDLISFGMRLKEIRKFHQMTQLAVAEHLDVSEKTVQNWENGKKAPTIDNITYLADLYNMRIGEILQDEDYRLFNKRYKSRIRTIETFEIPGYIETYAEITEDNYYNNYQIWVFDAFARHKLMHASLARVVNYDEVKDYVLSNTNYIVSEYREWLLSILSNEELDIHIKEDILGKIKCESAGMYSPGCTYINGTVSYSGGKFDNQNNCNG